MFEISWAKMMVIAVVALIVIGPKELIPTLRTLGRMITKTRRMAEEFQQQFVQAMREAELEEVRQEIAAMDREVTTVFDPAAGASPRSPADGTVSEHAAPPPSSSSEGSAPPDSEDRK